MKATSLDPVVLLDTLKGYPFLYPYTLAVYSPHRGIVASRRVACRLCANLGRELICVAGSACPLEQAARESISGSLQAVFRCHFGILGFAVRLPDASASDHCLLGWGVREEFLNLAHLENIARKCELPPFPLLDQWIDMPVIPLHDVKETAEKIGNLLPSLQGQNLQANLLEKTLEQLNSVVHISSQIDRARNEGEILRLMSESLGIIFDFPMIAFAMPDETGQSFTVKGTWGLPEHLVDLPVESLSCFTTNERFSISAEDLPQLFRFIAADRAACFPLVSDEEILGLLFLFNAEPHQRESLQISILCGRAAARLKGLRTDSAATPPLPQRLLTLSDSLAGAENGTDLYGRILEAAAELLNASSGSLMILDESETQLRITASLGINAQISRNMRLKVGEGIAGKVAVNGTPIVVNNIEDDSRIAAANRPRFKTKSFLSTPLKLKNKTIGVLNLSDKETGEPFTGSDLQLVNVLLAQACVLIERNELMDRAEGLEQVSVVDPLTGLYNRGFLLRRLDEEVSRCSRHTMTFSLLLMELDYFQLYLELGGRESAEHALRRMSAILVASARQMDVVGRYADATFFFLAPETPGENSLTIARRVRKAIEQEIFPGEDSLPDGKLALSVGIAAFPGHGADAAAILSAATDALYRAKAEGRNRINTFAADETLVTGTHH
jgi:diguanylate cyclase (GGDEF)-like protein